MRSCVSDVAYNEGCAGWPRYNRNNYSSVGVNDPFDHNTFGRHTAAGNYLLPL